MRFGTFDHTAYFVSPNLELCVTIDSDGKIVQIQSAICIVPNFLLSILF